jgi:hypothetical protein
MNGAVAVVLGGSRALGTASTPSDWDLGVYYRGKLDTAPLARFGAVHPPGSWGRIMNGGAWLVVDGMKVDVLLRDGEFEIDGLLGYLAGVPTYSLLAERAVAVTLRGELAPPGDYPGPLASAAPPRWRFCRDFSLEYARMHARRGDVVGTVGQAAKAAMEEAHARAAAGARWVLNEKRLLGTLGLASTNDHFAEMPRNLEGLPGWIDRLAELLADDRPT